MRIWLYIPVLPNRTQKVAVYGAFNTQDFTAQFCEWSTGDPALGANAGNTVSLLRRASMHDGIVFRTLDVEKPDQSAFGARQRVVDQRVATAAVDLEVDDRRATRRHGDGLHAGERRGRDAAERIYVIENFSDDME